MASCPYKSNLENMSSSLFAVKACGLADATYPTVICRTQLRLVMKSISVQTPGSRQDMCGTNAVPKGVALQAALDKCTTCADVHSGCGNGCANSWQRARRKRRRRHLGAARGRASTGTGMLNQAAPQCPVLVHTDMHSCIHTSIHARTHACMPT